MMLAVNGTVTRFVMRLLIGLEGFRLQILSKWAGSSLIKRGLLLVAVVGIGGWLIQQQFGAAEPLAPQTYKVTRGDLDNSIGSLGSLEPRDYVDVGTQVSGQLQQLLVAIGDEVEQGQLLAEIDPTVFASRVRSSQASYDNLKAQLAQQQAEQTLALTRRERNRALFKETAISEDVLLASETEVDVNQARMSALKAQIDSALAALEGDTANLGYTKIYAPMSGTVVDASAIQGQTINASQTAPTLVRIANLSVMTVRAQVSEADVVKIYEGMPVYFTTLGQPQRRWRAVVRQVLPTPTVVNNVVLYNVLIDTDNDDRVLMTSMTAQVFFLLGEAQDVLLVPIDALKTDGLKRSGSRPQGARGEAQDKARADGGQAKPERAEGERVAGERAEVEVLVDGKVERRKVVLGERNRTHVEVKSGLVEGELVITGSAVANRIGAAAGNRGLLEMGPPRR